MDSISSILLYAHLYIAINQLINKILAVSFVPDSRHPEIIAYAYHSEYGHKDSKAKCPTCRRMQRKTNNPGNRLRVDRWAEGGQPGLQASMQ
jgi:hypothetical protein